MSVITRWFVDLRTPTVRWISFDVPFQEFQVQVHFGRLDREGEGVDRHSTVVASFCELATLPGQPLDFPFIGSAPMGIRNIAPRDDGIVDMWLYVQWGTPLDLRISFLVAND